MSIQELSAYTAVSKYACYLEKQKRRETWAETVARTEGMMLGRYPGLADRIRWAYDGVRRLDVLGSQRVLQFGGPPVLKHNVRAFNCAGSYADRLAFFQEAFYVLLCGSGVGFSVQERHIRHLPLFSRARRSGQALVRKAYRPEDSIEGWANCVGVLVSSYFDESTFPEYADCEVDFDLGPIRAEGSPLAHGVGKAPGPDPLTEAISAIRQLLDRCLAAGQERLRSIDVYDLVMHYAKAVISGGVRRSSCICVFDVSDLEMAKAKTGTWRQDNLQRSGSNNSALLLRGQTFWDDFKKLFTWTKQFGEPGFYWASHADCLPNPCFRGNTRLATKDGLVCVKDLFNKATTNKVAVDRRPAKGSYIDFQARGIDLRDASPVVLTQANAVIYRVETEHGYAIEATANHQFPTLSGRKRLDELVIGETLLLQSGEGAFGTFGSLEEGYLLGMTTGDGCFCGEEAFIDIWERTASEADTVLAAINAAVASVPSLGQRPCGNLKWCNCTSPCGTKKRIGSCSFYRFIRDRLGVTDPASIKGRVPECVWRGSRDFVRGYLRGFFVTDGCPQGSERGTRGAVEIRLNQSNRELLADVQQLLLNFGVVSRIYSRRPEGEYLLPDAKGGEKLYHCRENYELVVNRPNLLVLLDRVGLVPHQQAEAEARLDARGRSCRKPERFLTRVASVAKVAVEDVYCLCQPETNTVIANGVVTGQCVEIGFWPKLALRKDDPSVLRLLKDYRGPIERDGDEIHLSGWQFCNLSTINGRTVRDEADFYERCRQAAFLGTLQADFTDFPYLGEVSERITRKEALLGVSISGIMHHPDLLLRPEVQEQGALEVLVTNETYAPCVGVQPCARGTCMKPDGNSGSLLGGLPGHGAGKFRRGFRVVQANRHEAPYQHFQAHNPQACEPSVWSNADCIRFCLEYEPDTLLEEDLAAVEMLEYVKLTQMHWVEAGKVLQRCSRPWLSHNVSNTIRVRDHEWDEVASYLFANQDYFAGVSLLAQSGDREYEQAPFTAVFTPEEQAGLYGPHAPVDAAILIEKACTLFASLWDGCSLVLNESTRPATAEQMVWVNEMRRIAHRHFRGDLRKLTHCLKDCFNWQLWLRLKDSFVPVDYSRMVEEENGVCLQQEIACAGGSCERTYMPEQG